MSWDIFPKDKVEYFLDKLKDIFDSKVDIVAGKGLSTNDYTTTEKNKLAGIQAGAQVNPTIDNALSGTSTNAVQNKVVKSALDGKANTGDIPSVSNNTITIQLNGTTIESFTLNQSADETINIQVTKSDVGLGNVGNYKAVSTVANQGLTDTEKSNSRANIGAGTSNFSGAYADLTGQPTIPSKTSQLTNDSGYVTTDTKNTAGSTDTSSKIFLVGATSQAANPQTYSHDTAYVGTDGCLYSGGTKVLTSHQDISGKADKSATVSAVAWDSTNKKLTKTINGTTTDVVTGATILGGLTKAQVTTALGYTPPTSDTNTHRPIQMNGSQILGDNTTALNLKAGSNVSLSNSSGTVTIAATDTTYESKSAASGGTAVSLVTTGEKYTWNNKSSFSGAYADLTGKPTIPTKTSQLTNDSGFVTADNKVGQTNTTNSASYRMLFSETADDTTRTEGARKSENLKFNPSTGTLSVNGSGALVSAKKFIAGLSGKAGSLSVYGGVSSGGTAGYGTGNIKASLLTYDRDFELPNESGTLVTDNYLNSKIRVVSGNLASSPGGTTILTEANLSTNYLIIGYCVMNGSTPYQWWYNNVISEIWINGNNLSIKHTNSAVNGRPVYVFLYRLS